MNQPSNPPEPDYVVCNCQNCSGHIEFDAIQFTPNNSVVPCPHCGVETKLYIPFLDAENDLSQLRPSPASPTSVKHEGFFCGTPFTPDENVRNQNPTISNPQYTDEQIRLIGDRENDESAIKLFHEGEQETTMSIEDARRYITDPRFKLMNPETGLRFTPATLEAFINSRRLHNKIETNKSIETSHSGASEDVGQNPISHSKREPSGPYKHKRVRFEKGARIALSREQRESPTGKQLIALLDEIVRDGASTDGIITEDGVRRLNGWLDKQAGSDILAISFLLQISDRILRKGKVTTARAFEMQFAIERVLPASIREEFKKVRQDAWVHSPLKPKASQAQLEYIRSLGGNPLPGLNTSEASLLIESLLQHATPASEQRATEKQMEYIRILGANPPPGLSKADASSLIEELHAKRREASAKNQPPSSRQIMVLRFWNRLDLAQSSKWEVEQWLDQFYAEDPRRKEAWTEFKLENGDDGSQRDPSWVTIGLGDSYLSKRQ